MEYSNSHIGQTSSGRLPRSLDRLGVKLFLAIAGANLILVMAVYLGYSWSFDKGLVDYVNQSEQARLAPVITQLADGYRQHGDWHWVADDRERWADLLSEVLGWRVGRRDWMRGIDGQGGRGAGADVEVPLPPITIDWRVMLFDAQHKALILYPGGDADEAALAVKLPIQVGGSTVGYLGYIPRLAIVQSLESITAQQQSRRFGVIGIGMLAAVLLNAALISTWLSRRLRALGQGATALARGDYDARIRTHGHDELAQLGNDFNHLAQALAAAQRGRQQWIADIAHELRTPLTTLRVEIEAMQDGIRPLTLPAIASVAQEVHRLTRLVEDLRLLSLSDLGALTYRREPVLLSEVVGDALAVGAAAIAERGLQLETRLDPQLVVDVDVDRMAQVFGNLLQNTLRYSEAPGQLRITVAAHDGQARIDWEDSAPGVSDTDLPRLTERLYRVDASRSSASGGSGLGLAIVTAIVTAHGGRMEAAHSPLGGLCWHIWLPLSDRPA